MFNLSAHGAFFHWSFAATWFWVTVLIGIVWLRRHLDLNRARNEPVLTSAAAGSSEARPKISVLVAAKDEEANIARCLTSIQAQDYPNLEIIVIDDRSQDRTPAIIDEFAAGDPRVRALHVTELPPDWGGKHHAMHTGVQAATGDYLCFTDADCAFQQPQLLAAAVSHAADLHIDLLCILPELEVQTFWERVLQPPASAILLFWYPPEKVNDAESSRAYANGAFMLMPRRAYDQIGGHEAVRHMLHEDIHMADNTKKAGLRLQVMRGPGMYSVRMYTSLRETWKGWTRIFYACFRSVSWLLTSMLVLAIFSLSPYVTLGLSPLAGAAWVYVAAAAGFTIVVQLSVLTRFYRMCGMGPAWALTYPLGALICFAMMASALTKHTGRKVVWRGTAYAGRV